MSSSEMSTLPDKPIASHISQLSASTSHARSEALAMTPKCSGVSLLAHGLLTARRPSGTCKVKAILWTTAMQYRANAAYRLKKRQGCLGLARHGRLLVAGQK